MQKQVPGVKVSPNSQAKYNDRQNDFGNSFVEWMKPHQRQGKWANRKKTDNNCSR